MKVFIALFALVAVAIAAPPTVSNPDAVASVVKSDFENIGVEGFNYGYETSNGISAQAQGQLVNAGAENEAVVVKGSFQYTGSDGVVYSVTYIADENGFQPQGAHLPQPPQ